MIINVPSKAGYNYNVRTHTLMCNPAFPRKFMQSRVCISLKSASALGTPEALRMNTPDLPDCPKYMECPILQERMADPVVAKDHHTYERTAIESWFDNVLRAKATQLLL